MPYLANRAVAGMLGGWKGSLSAEGIKHSLQILAKLANLVALSALTRAA